MTKAIIGLLTAAAGLARDIIGIWREETPTPRAVNREPLEKLRGALCDDARDDGLAVMERNIVERSKR